MSKFNYIGPYNRTGYGIASILLMSRLGRELESYTPVSGVDPSLFEIYDIPPSTTLNIGRPADRSFIFWHMSEVAKYSKDGNRDVLYTTFETDNFSQKEKDSLKASNITRVITASRWGTNRLTALRNELDLNTEDMPIIRHGASLEMCRRQDLILSSERFDTNDLVLSTCGKFEYRKSQRELIEFLAKSDRNITLIISANNPFVSSLLSGYLISLGCRVLPRTLKLDTDHECWKINNLTIYSLPYLADEAKLYSILFKADYFISLSKGEGWNIPLYNALSYNIPCIYSGIPVHKELIEYSGNIRSKELEINGLEFANDGMFFGGDRGQWFTFDINTFDKLLTDPPERDIKLINKDSWQDALKIVKLFQ